MSPPWWFVASKHVFMHLSVFQNGHCCKTIMIFYTRETISLKKNAPSPVIKVLKFTTIMSRQRGELWNFDIIVKIVDAAAAYMAMRCHYHCQLRAISSASGFCTPACILLESSSLTKCLTIAMLMGVDMFSPSGKRTSHGGLVCLEFLPSKKGFGSPCLKYIVLSKRRLTQLLQKHAFLSSSINSISAAY